MLKPAWLLQLLLVAATIPFPAAAEVTCADKALGQYRVDEVVDAHTLRLEDGSMVRLMGALPPQTPIWWKKPQLWPPSAFAHKYLAARAEGQHVELRIAAGEPERDRHERVLAQVFVRRGETFEWLQAKIIGDGHAQAYSFPAHKACARSLQQREERARRERHGLWRDGRYKVHTADRTETLLKLKGSYQLVEGRVASVGQTRNWSFLNFSSDWRSDFTVAVPASSRKLFKASGVLFEELQGKRVRVRGWIERWNGPVIKANHAEQIELLP